ncbi:MAG: thiamine diphosphokinase [Oscillospiraceae bacterium]|nr:thiamine diphosphokinase [Oscillospiraceae bacterium]
MTCIIVGASPECAAIAEHENAQAFVIAVDGGYDRLTECGIVPDLVIGDFDSLTGKLPVTVETLRFPQEKDESDTELAVQEAIRRGCKAFRIYGALGGRLDHTLANIALMISLSERGYDCRLIGEREWLTAVVSNSRFKLDCATGQTVSVFTADESAHGVTLTGFKYPLANAVLQRGTRGLSNEVTE